MDDIVVIYGMGIVHCSACAPSEMPIEAVTEYVNAHSPSGTTHGWHLDTEGHFADGTPMPSVCNTDPARTHYLFTC